MSKDYTVCGVCGSTNCTCPRTAPQLHLLQLLHTRTEEIGQYLRYMADDKFPAGDALQALRAILARHYPNPTNELITDISDAHAKMLPAISVPEGTILVYNQVHRQIALLVNIIRLHIPAVDFLEASRYLDVIAEFAKKHEIRRSHEHVSFQN